MNGTVVIELRSREKMFSLTRRIKSKKGQCTMSSMNRVESRMRFAIAYVGKKALCSALLDDLVAEPTTDKLRILLNVCKGVPYICNGCVNSLLMGEEPEHDYDEEQVMLYSMSDILKNLADAGVEFPAWHDEEVNPKVVLVPAANPKVLVTEDELSATRRNEAQALTQSERAKLIGEVLRSHKGQWFTYAALGSKVGLTHDQVRHSMKRFMSINSYTKARSGPKVVVSYQG